jgi:hypothetical protein
MIELTLTNSRPVLFHRRAARPLPKAFLDRVVWPLIGMGTKP